MPVEPAYYPIEAFDPTTGGTRTLRIMHQDVDEVLRFAPEHRLYELAGSRIDHKGSCVKEVLSKPTGVFGGVRERQEGGVCYCGIPSRRWFKGGSSGPPPPGMVFLVFVNPRGHVFEWRWEQADQDNPQWPPGFDDAKRFREGRIWP